MPADVVNRRGLVMVNLAVALFGLAGVLGGLTGLPSPLVVLGRVLFGGGALFGLICLLRRDPRVRHSDLALLGGQGVLLALHWTTFFQAIAVSSVAIGLLAFATFPLFTALLEPPIMRTRLSRSQVAAALCIVAGIVVLVPDLSLDSAVTQGVLWGLASAATFGLLSVLNRKLGQSYSSLVVSLYQNGVAAAVLLPVLLVVSPEPLFQPRALLLLVVLGVGCTAVAHTLFIAGLQHMTAQLASLIASLEPVWGIVLGVLILGEVPTARSLLGGAIIVGATMLPTAYAYRCARPAHSGPSSGHPAS